MDTEIHARVSDACHTKCHRLSVSEMFSKEEYFDIWNGNSLPELEMRNLWQVPYLVT
jgi:hypothetical protein